MRDTMPFATMLTAFVSWPISTPRALPSFDSSPPGD